MMGKTTAHGFTLMELMIAVAIVAIAAAIAVPSLQTFVKNNRIKDRMYELIDSIGTARSEAVNRAKPTIICPVPDPLAAAPVCGVSVWTQGWVVFIDADASGAFSAGDTVLRTALAEISTKLTINGDTYGKNGLLVNADGTSGEKDGAGTLQDAVIAICDDRDTGYGVSIRYTKMGRPVLTKGTVTTPITSCSP